MYVILIDIESEDGPLVYGTFAHYQIAIKIANKVQPDGCYLIKMLRDYHELL